MLDGLHSRSAFPDERVRFADALLAERKGAHLKFFLALLAGAETTAMLATAVAAKFLYIDLVLGQSQPMLPYVLPAVLLGCILHLFLKQANLYDPEAIDDFVVGYGKICGALAMSVLVLIGVLYLFKMAEDYSRGWFLTWFALSAVALIAVHVFAKKTFRRLVSEGRIHQRLALYGTMDFLTTMRTQIRDSAPVNVVAGQYLAQPAAVTTSDWQIDGGLNELKADLLHNAYDKILIGLPASDPDRIRAAVGELASYSTELLLCSELEPYPVVVRETRNFGPLRTNVINLVPLSERNGLLKTIVDYSLASVGLLLISPLLAVIALAIKVDSPGPVFFRQRRYGRNNRVFRIFKFRTMAVAEDGAVVKQAERGDPRVTRVGRFLRMTSLDELPQLINVLAGDMSLVGPRPHALAHDQAFESQLDQFSRRRRVRPGMTGWAQVHGFRGETRTDDAIRGRMQHDLYYIENWSFWLDIEIMTRTLFVLFRRAY